MRNRKEKGRRGRGWEIDSAIFDRVFGENLCYNVENVNQYGAVVYF